MNKEALNRSEEYACSDSDSNEDFLETFYKKLKWKNVPRRISKTHKFIDDFSREQAREHSYAIKMIENKLNLNPRYYTSKDLKNEQKFLDNLAKGETIIGSEQSYNVLKPGEVKTLINYDQKSSLSYHDIKKYYRWKKNTKHNYRSSACYDKEIQDIINRLEQERIKFQEFAKKRWFNGSNAIHGKILPDVKKYVNELWKARISSLNDYPQFYKQLMMVPLLYNFDTYEENDIKMTPGKILKKMGKPGRFFKIPLDQLVFICNDYNIITKEMPVDYKYPTVSQDPVTERLVQSSEPRIVMSPSALKCLLDNKSSNFFTTWSLPICIKEYKKDKISKLVVFIDKKLPPKMLTDSQKTSWYCKIGSRILYCQDINSINYNNSGNNAEPNNCSESDDSWQTLSSTNQSEGEEMDCDQYEDKEDLCTTSPNKKFKNDCGIDDCDQNISNKCYVYQTWFLEKENKNQLIKSDGEIIPILIRSKRDCTNQKYKEKKRKKSKLKQALLNNELLTKLDEKEYENVVHIVPKLEHQFELGAERITGSECVRHWIDSVVRQNSQVYRVRINPITLEVIQIEKTNEHSIKMEGMKWNINLPKLWFSLYSILSKLITLGPGHYLLDHTPKHGPFCALYTAIDKPVPGRLNLYSDYNISVEEVATNYGCWIPLDENIETPMCRYKKLLPLIFPPSNYAPKIEKSYIRFDADLSKNKKKKKKKKKSKNKLSKNLKGTNA